MTLTYEQLQSIKRRFAQKVDVDHPSGCWTWTAGTTSDGYPHFYLGTQDGRRVVVRAHRVSWDWLVGELPQDGLELHHVCENKRCVHADHLQAVRPRVNLMATTQAAKRAGQTRCLRGHPFTDANTYWSKGHRT